MALMECNDACKWTSWKGHVLKHHNNQTAPWIFHLIYNCKCPRMWHLIWKWSIANICGRIVVFKDISNFASRKVPCRLKFVNTDFIRQTDWYYRGLNRKTSMVWWHLKKLLTCTLSIYIKYIMNENNYVM